jgi:hypothetical protein
MNDIKHGGIFEFNLADPLSYECAILSYVIGHSRMIMQVDKNEQWRGPDTFYLVFEPTEYYSGPLRWFGAGFHIGPHEKCKELLASTYQQQFVAKEPEFLPGWQEDYKLFLVDGVKSQVQIVAFHEVRAFKTLPPLS